ncbi:unnamed protein product, partial [Rotaria sordida]
MIKRIQVNCIKDCRSNIQRRKKLLDIDSPCIDTVNQVRIIKDSVQIGFRLTADLL